MKLRIVALVPMRHHSERVPGKNYRPLGGKPLYRHIIETLQGCPEIDEIVIDTDSQIVKEDSAKTFPNVKVLDRPKNLRDGKIPMNDILLNDVNEVRADVYVQTHSTNPLLRSETIQRALTFFLEHRATNDSLFSVTRVQSRLWDKNAKAINHDPKVLLRTQDLPPVFEENSCLYIFTRESLETNRARIGKTPLMLEIDRIEAWDIDEEIHFQIAELLYQTRSKHT